MIADKLTRVGCEVRTARSLSSLYIVRVTGICEAVFRFSKRLLNVHSSAAPISYHALTVWMRTHPPYSAKEIPKHLWISHDENPFRLDLELQVWIAAQIIGRFVGKPQDRLLQQQIVAPFIWFCLSEKKALVADDSRRRDDPYFTLCRGTKFPSLYSNSPSTRVSLF